MDLTGRTVAVTGATGFLGSHIALELARRGARVRGVVRSPEKGAWLEAHGVELVAADLRDRPALAEAFSGADAVVSNAALSTRRRASWEEYELANVHGTENAVGAVADAGVPRVVQVSSCAIYRTRFLRVLDETAEQVAEETVRRSWSRLVTNWRYAWSKALGERRAWEIAEGRGLGLTVVRPGPIYGSRDHKVTAIYARLAARVALALPTARMPHVHAADVASAVAGALANDGSSGRAYNLTGECVSPHHVVRVLKGLLGHRGLLAPVPVPLWIAFDDAAASRDLGFRSRSIEEGLREAVENGFPA